jgi:DNA-binding MarR family transcriptional regulator
MSELGRDRINDRIALLSHNGEVPNIYDAMAKPNARSTLYRLIEAGQLTHKALLVPLIERGLEPGDDAVLFILHSQLGATEAELAAELGIEGEALATRIERLIERDLIARRAIGPDLVPGLALTERGERIREVLTANWEELEAALFGELAKKERKALGRTLERFVELLRL